MAKNHRPSGTSGTSMKSFTKIGRNAQSGQFVEVTKVHGGPWLSVLEVRGSGGVVRERVVQSATLKPKQPIVEAVLERADNEGLTVHKDGRIAGRVSSELVAKAKEKTGITSDTELLEFALASIAVEDKFAEAFHAVRGTVDPDLDFGF